LEVPNLDDALLAVYGIQAYRCFYFRAPHVYYYSAATLQRMMECAGFTGRAISAQAYSLFNHVHWLQQAGPQPMQALGYSIPNWSAPPGAERASIEIRRWMSEADANYKDLLASLGAGDLLCYEGRPSEALRAAHWDRQG
jgi:hypothetical protein